MTSSVCVLSTQMPMFHQIVCCSFLSFPFPSINKHKRRRRGTSCTRFSRPLFGLLAASFSVAIASFVVALDALKPHSSLPKQASARPLAKALPNLGSHTLADRTHTLKYIHTHTHTQTNTHTHTNKHTQTNTYTTNNTQNRTNNA